MPAEGQHRPVRRSLAGVVVDHVQDHLDAGRVHRPHHRLELAHLVAAEPSGVGGVGGVRGEEADRVVAPVVLRAAFLQRRLVHEVVDRQQLHRGHPEPLEVGDRGRVGQPGVGAAQVVRDVRVPGGEALDVQLVDDGVVPGDVRPPVAAPREAVVEHHHRPRHERGRVQVVVAVAGRVVDEVALDGPGVRVDQQLGRVVPLAHPRVVRAGDPVAVALAGVDAGQVAVPDVEALLGQFHPVLAALAVEQADLHLGCAG